MRSVRMTVTGEKAMSTRPRERLLFPAVVAGCLVMLLFMTGLEPASVNAEVAWVGDPRRVAVSPDGKHLYAAGDFWGNEIGNIAVLSRDGGTGALTFVESHVNGASGVEGLAYPTAVTVSPDGANVYLASARGNAVAVFSRDGGTGELTFVEAQIDGVGGVDGLAGASCVRLSPDGAHVYVTSGTNWGADDDAVAVFSRDAGTGELTFVEVQFDGVGGVDGVDGARSVAVSPDGAHVYVAGPDDNAVAVFNRDETTGALTFVEAQFDGVGGVEGLYFPLSVTVSPEGTHVYVGTSPGIAVFDRDPASGQLTFVEAESAGGGGIATVSPDGGHVYVVGDIADRLSVFSRDGGTGELTFVDELVDDVAGVDGLDGASGVTVSPNGAHVYVASLQDQAVAVFSRDGGTGELTFVEAFSERHVLLSGKKLLIKNKVPEDKESNKAVWSTAKQAEIRTDGTGKNTPVCNEDPPGTVKASIRFFSGSSGHDTGPIDLPCENWQVIPASGHWIRGYVYRDRRLEKGPCKRVLLRASPLFDERNQIKARCSGRGATMDFLYDLTEGTDEGDVNVVLTVGRGFYCTATDDFNGKNGSDGKRFVGKDSPPPLARCPIPPGSPSAAFLDVTSGVLD